MDQFHDDDDFIVEESMTVVGEGKIVNEEYEKHIKKLINELEVERKKREDLEGLVSKIQLVK
jgi:hypothetical protein